VEENPKGISTNEQPLGEKVLKRANQQRETGHKKEKRRPRTVSNFQKKGESNVWSPSGFCAGKKKKKKKKRVS